MAHHIDQLYIKVGKVSAKYYVVIDHIATGHPYQTIWDTLQVFLLYSYSDLIDKSSVLVLVKGRNTTYNW